MTIESCETRTLSLYSGRGASSLTATRMAELIQASSMLGGIQVCCLTRAPHGGMAGCQQHSEFPYIALPGLVPCSWPWFPQHTFSTQRTPWQEESWSSTAAVWSQQMGPGPSCSRPHLRKGLCIPFPSFACQACSSPAGCHILSHTWSAAPCQSPYVAPSAPCASHTPVNDKTVCPG